MATPWAVGEAVLEHNLGNSVVPTSSTSPSNMFYTMVIGSAVLTIERLDKLFTNKQITAESGISRSTFTVSRGRAQSPKPIRIGPRGARRVESRSKPGLQNTKLQTKERWLRVGGLLSLLRLFGDLSTVGADQKLPRVEQTTWSNLEAHKCVAHLLPKADVAMRMLDGLAYTRTLDAGPFKPHGRRGTRLNTFRSPGREGAAV